MTGDQLDLKSLPVADPVLVAERAHERYLAQLLEAVAVTLDMDGKSAPTTRDIAESLQLENAPPTSAPFKMAARGLAELRDRGALIGTADTPGYFARDDDGPTVMRWNRKTP